MHLATQSALAAGSPDRRADTGLADDPAMSRRSDPIRIEAARRAAAIARLISHGEIPDRAAAWVARWEATIAGPSDRADWEGFDAWLRTERKRPSTGEPTSGDLSSRSEPAPLRPATQPFRADRHEL
jgi:hypothetical protein